MFDLAFSEILVIAAACLIFLRPEDMPRVMRQVGRFIRKIRKEIEHFTSLLDEEEKAIKPKNKVMGLDGQYHDAYDVEEVFDKKEHLENIEDSNEHSTTDR